MIVIGLWWQWPLCGNWKCRQDYWSVDAKRGWDAPGCHLHQTAKRWKLDKLVSSPGKGANYTVRESVNGNGCLVQLWLKPLREEKLGTRNWGKSGECVETRGKGEKEWMWTGQELVRVRSMYTPVNETYAARKSEEQRHWRGKWVNGVNIRFSEMWMSSDVQISLKIRKW